MAEEFNQGGVCGGNWWQPSRSLFGSSPCAMAINDIGSFGWLNHDNLVTNMRSTTRSSDNSPGSASDSCTQQHTMSSMDSTNIQMMFPSSTTADNWDQNLVHNNRSSDENYSTNNILQEATGLMNSSTSYPNFSQNFPLQQQQQQPQPLNPITSEGISSSSNFPLNSASYSAYTSSLLQTLFDTDSQEYLLDNQAMNYSSAPNYGINSSQMLASFPKASNNTVNPDSFGKQPTAANHLPFWNGTAAAMTDVRSSFPPSAQPQLLPTSLHNKDSGLPSYSTPKNSNKEARNSASLSKKASNIEPPFKRPRIETPSPLPTFKVRKEKLGDRITALQQLVSPFGKTDTASVLYEAIEYIKFLHNQVSALSTPYLKSGSQRQQVAGKLSKDQQEGQKQDLRSRGLCLVPISSTFPVAAETSSDFWTPTFGGTFR